MAENDAAPTILITGASGLIGSKLVTLLEDEGYRVLRAVRRPAQNDLEVSWNPRERTIEEEKLEGLDAVIHLAGAGIAAKRWNESYKQLLLDSRVEGTTLIAETLARLSRKPRVFACASAIGYYGDCGETELDESASLWQ